jgi:hypothetical protein
MPWSISGATLLMLGYAWVLGRVVHQQHLENHPVKGMKEENYVPQKNEGCERSRVDNKNVTGNLVRIFILWGLFDRTIPLLLLSKRPFGGLLMERLVLLLLLVVAVGKLQIQIFKLFLKTLPYSLATCTTGLFSTV